MAQIVATGSKGHHTFRLTLTETATSVESNTSTLTASFIVDPTTYNWSGISGVTYNLSIDGNNYSGSITEVPYSSQKTIREITGISIPHNDDGTKTISYSFSVSDGANKSYTSGNASASGEMTLTIIPRASSFSSVPSSVYIEDICSIKISKKLNTYTSTLEYKISGSSTWIPIVNKWNPDTNLSQTYRWEVPRSIYDGMSSTAKWRTITIRLTTYNGDSIIGDAKTKTLIAKAMGSPSIISISIIDTNDITTVLTQDNKKIVNGVSNIKVTVNATGINGTTISKITCNGTIMSLDDGVGTLIINKCTISKFTIMVTDSRGATCLSTANRSANFINYIPLSATMSAVKDQPTSDSAILLANGKYSAITFSEGIANILTTSYQYRLAGSSDNYISGTLTQSISDSNYTASKTISGLDYTKDYEVVMTISDKISSLTKTLILKKGVPVFYWDKDSVYLKSGNPILDYKTVIKEDTSLNVVQLINKNGEDVYVNPIFDYKTVSKEEASSKVVQLINKNGENIYVNPYPVGSIYLSVNSESPAMLFGGTWEQIKDRFLLACGDTYANNSVGGEATVTLKVEEMPSHIHTLTPFVDIRQGDGQVNAHSGSLGTHLGGYVSKPNAYVSSTGGDQPHNNMPPYLSIYMWKRIA